MFCNLELFSMIRTNIINMILFSEKLSCQTKMEEAEKVLSQYSMKIQVSKWIGLFSANYLENLFNGILNIFYRSGLRALDPYLDPQHCFNEILNKTYILNIPNIGGMYCDNLIFSWTAPLLFSWSWIAALM